MDNYEVRVIKKAGYEAVIQCSGRNVDRTAVRESKRRVVAHSEVWFANVWVCTFVNGVRAFGASGD